MSEEEIEQEKTWRDIIGIISIPERIAIGISILGLIVAGLSLFLNIHEAEKTRRFSLYSELLDAFAFATKNIEGEYKELPINFYTAIWKAPLINEELTCPIHNIKKHYENSMTEIEMLTKKLSNINDIQKFDVDNFMELKVTRSIELQNLLFCMSSLYQKEIGIVSSFACNKEQISYLKTDCKDKLNRDPQEAYEEIKREHLDPRIKGPTND